MKGKPLAVGMVAIEAVPLTEVVLHLHSDYLPVWIAMSLLWAGFTGWLLVIINAKTDIDLIVEQHAKGKK